MLFEVLHEFSRLYKIKLSIVCMNGTHHTVELLCFHLSALIRRRRKLADVTDCT
jgi:hypothetical protein